MEVDGEEDASFSFYLHGRISFLLGRAFSHLRWYYLCTLLRVSTGNSNTPLHIRRYSNEHQTCAIKGPMPVVECPLQ